jgi:photosystem II stability/assembly factor-like uncharacterized protein
MWIDVTPADMSPAVLSPTPNAFGPGAVVADPAHPNELYIAGSEDGLWKSPDYGNTWARINTMAPGVAHGTTLAVASSTVWIAAGGNTGRVYKSLDGGLTFNLTGNAGLPSDLYSLVVDPYDTNHLLSGLHEADGIVESIDGGDHWAIVGGTNFPTGGVSWYPFFVDTGSASTTHSTWFAIAQNGASAIMTSDAGASWSIPSGLDGLQHPHGNAQLYQTGQTLFVAGTAGPGQGVYRSTDRGTTWSRVSGDAAEAIVWGTPKNVYAMWAWACSNCDLGANYLIAAQPGTTWSPATVPAALVIGPTHVAVIYDGTHYIFVGVMWAAGVWRYVEE